MQKTTVLYIIIALLSGFILGFLLANSLNRSDYSTSFTTEGGLPVGHMASSQTTLSPEEIRAKVAEADRNPDNFSFQKDLGLALYRYGAMTQNVELIEESRRLLDRARSLNAEDFDVLVGLGHSEFDVGFYRKDLASFQRARSIYADALKINPADPDIQTDMGISYFVQEPPDYDRAETELKKVSAIDPRHERSLQFLIQVYARQKRDSDARAALDRLRSLNPSNPAVKELTSLVDSVEGGPN